MDTGGVHARDPHPWTAATDRAAERSQYHKDCGYACQGTWLTEGVGGYLRSGAQRPGARPGRPHASTVGPAAASGAQGRTCDTRRAPSEDFGRVSLTHAVGGLQDFPRARPRLLETSWARERQRPHQAVSDTGLRGRRLTAHAVGCTGRGGLDVAGPTFGQAELHPAMGAHGSDLDGHFFL